MSLRTPEACNSTSLASQLNRQNSERRMRHAFMFQPQKIIQRANWLCSVRDFPWQPCLVDSFKRIQTHAVDRLRSYILQCQGTAERYRLAVVSNMFPGKGEGDLRAALRFARS